MEERGLSSRPTQEAGRDTRLGNLQTPINVQKLQSALHAKAKEEPEYRFYLLYDKVSGSGWARYPNQYLYEQLGLVNLPARTHDLPWAKA